MEHPSCLKDAHRQIGQLIDRRGLQPQAVDRLQRKGEAVRGAKRGGDNLMLVACSRKLLTACREKERQ